MANLGAGLGRVALGALADTRYGEMNTVITAIALAGVSQWVLWSVAELRRSWDLGMLFAVVYGFFGGGYLGSVVLPREACKSLSSFVIRVIPVVLPHMFDPSRLYEAAALLDCLRPLTSFFPQSGDFWHILHLGNLRADGRRPNSGCNS